MAFSPLKTASWNIAAVNNNPFEYWITHPDPQYEELMAGVQGFIDDAGDRDVAVSEVFTPAMFDELAASMTAVGWEGVDQVAECYRNDFCQRPIVSGFMTDKDLGAKRLASMPDRVSNTINSAGGAVCRPTVINLYEEPMDSVDAWWAQWKTFVFDTTVNIKGKDTPVHGLFGPIKRSKYPAVTELEESISIPLQTMVLAIFDAILVHIMNSVSPAAWHGIKMSLCEALNKKKVERTLEIMVETYADTDVIFLQEAAAVFIDQMGGTALAERYHIFSPEKIDAKRDQNSIILASRAKFTGVFSEVTAECVANLPENAPVSAGDLCAVATDGVDGNKYLLASFHGDTNGLATIPVVEAVNKVVSGDTKLLFGMDANCYFKGKAGKTLGVDEFGEFFTKLGLASCFDGLVPGGPLSEVLPHTTFNARTFLQPQLNKAIKLADRETSPLTDRNPKDFILFKKGAFVPKAIGSDNDGSKGFDAAAPFPTLSFPSDHAVLSATLELGQANAAAAEGGASEGAAGKIPVTVLTGFLGSGKTTLMNNILNGSHGKKIAVIENEFGEIGIDDSLVSSTINADEEIFEMNNGCICCTVRGDLIRILNKLLSRPKRLDGVLIETTGMADPAPVAQTFFVDEQIQANMKLDAILTVVDAKHLIQHLDEEKPEGAENEAVEQVLFADKIILNKMDLVSEEEVAEVERRIRDLNKHAPILKCQNSQVDLGEIMNVGAFDLNRVLESEPDFLDPDAEHVHDETVTSVGISREGECDLAKLNAWFSKLLQEKGVDIYRMKGVLAIKDSAEKFVFQGVHMLFEAAPLKPWDEGEMRVVNKLVAV